MKDEERIKKIEDRITDLESRMNKMGGNSSCSDKKTIRIEIAWPEDDIGGLHFNILITTSEFELKEDGNYYSRDILFNSARDTDEGTGRDILSEYLNTNAVKQAVINALKEAGMEAKIIIVFLPEENQGVKKYNGVNWWYWLKPRYSGSSAHFSTVTDTGNSLTGNASSVGGCAPVFRVSEKCE